MNQETRLRLIEIEFWYQSNKDTFFRDLKKENEINIREDNG